MPAQGGERAVAAVDGGRVRFGIRRSWRGLSSGALEDEIGVAALGWLRVWKVAIDRRLQMTGFDLRRALAYSPLRDDCVTGVRC